MYPALAESRPSANASGRFSKVSTGEGRAVSNSTGSKAWLSTARHCDERQRHKYKCSKGIQRHVFKAACTSGRKALMPFVERSDDKGTRNCQGGPHQRRAACERSHESAKPKITEYAIAEEVAALTQDVMKDFEVHRVHMSKQPCGELLKDRPGISRRSKRGLDRDDDGPKDNGEPSANSGGFSFHVTRFLITCGRQVAC
jgi:hypothetical protein